MSLHKTFKTDTKLEQKGIEIDYGTTRFRIARAGGANTRFAAVLNERTRPYRRAIAADALPADQQRDILIDVYAETVVLDVRTKTSNGEWRSGINPEDLPQHDPKTISPETGLLPANKDNIVALFKALPELFNDIQQQAQNYALFKQEIDEALAGN